MANIGRPSTIRPALKKFGNARTALANLYSTRTLDEVAVKLGVTKGTVRNEMIRLGIRRRTSKTPAPAGRFELALAKRGQSRGESARQVFIRLYQTQGLTLRQIADQLGATPEGARSYANRANIPLRRRGIRTGTKISRSSNPYAYVGCL